MQQKPKLLEQVRAVARAGNLSHRTEDVYHISKLKNLKTTQIYTHVLKNKSFVKSPRDY